MTALPFDEAEQIVRRQVWTTDTLGPIHVSILGRRMKAAEVEQLAMIVCNGCAAQYDCALYALAADEQVGTWAIPQSWLQALRRRGDRRAVAVIEAARSRAVTVQTMVKAVLFKGDTPR